MSVCGRCGGFLEWLDDNRKRIGAGLSGGKESPAFSRMADAGP